MYAANAWAANPDRTWHVPGSVREDTLGRFGQEGAKHGGMDLLKVKQTLEQTIDEVRVRRVIAGLRFWRVPAIVVRRPVTAPNTRFD